MDNPLFGSNLFSPNVAQNALNNPMFAAPSSEPPSTAPGMRRLGNLQPWDLAAERATPGGPGLAVSAASASAALGRDRPEEAAFADALGRLVRGEDDPAQTIATYAEICRERAAELRDLASSQLQKAPRYIVLTEAAAELEAEASTWQLLWFLHGIPGREFPAGKGGDFVEGAGFAKTFRQLAADLIFQDDALNRAGRAVAWLEATAAAADPEPDQGLARKDGVWQETKGKLAAGPAARALGPGGTLVTELDPDATTRQKARLDTDNTKDEERLMRMVWRLIRSGRAARAAAACEHAGQPWRAASLSGGGPHGPLPLGTAADEADSADCGRREMEVLASEVENGPAVLRVLWRWACYQAAERVATTSESTGAGIHESAVYAVLSSHITRVLPACSTWEDSLWAHLRCWLDCAVDAELSGSVTWDTGARPAEALPADASQQDSAAASEGLSVITGAWPLPRIRNALPAGLEDVVEAGGALFGGASTSAAGAQRFRRVQIDLILDKVESMVSDALVRWIIDGTAAGGIGDQSDGPACPPALMRFAAHLALMLWSLGIAAVPENPVPGAAYSQLHDLLQRLVQVYTVHLIDSGAHALVPSYACHLRAGLRRTTYLLFLEQLLVLGDLDECRAAYHAGAECFNALGLGDVEPDEMGIIARKAASKSQMESSGGPLQRARSMVWLCFEQRSYADAVRWACILCREFALDQACGAAGAIALLQEVIPAGVGGEAPLERLLAAAEAEGAAGEAAELRGWLQFFELESEFSSWEAVYEAAVRDVQAAGEDPSQGALSELAQETLPLLQAALHFLNQGPCPWLAVGIPTAELGLGAPPSAGEVAMVVGPDQGFEAPQEVLSGEAYPMFSSAEEQAEVAAAVAAALKTAAGESPLGFHTGPAPDEGSVHLPGLISLAVDCGEDESAQSQAAALLSLALKGALQGPDGSYLGPLTATNVSASPAVVASMCRAAVYPRVALKAAALRQAVSFMGYLGNEGADVLESATRDENVGLFAPQEVRELRELDAAAVALQKKRQQSLANSRQE